MCLSITTPRKLKFSTLSILSPFRVGSSVTWLMSFCPGWKIMYFVLEIWMERRFIISHSPTRDNSLLISSRDVEMSKCDFCIFFFIFLYYDFSQVWAYVYKDIIEYIRNFCLVINTFHLNAYFLHANIVFLLLLNNFRYGIPHLVHFGSIFVEFIIVIHSFSFSYWFFQHLIVDG